MANRKKPSSSSSLSPSSFYGRVPSLDVLSSDPTHPSASSLHAFAHPHGPHPHALTLYPPLPSSLAGAGPGALLPWSEADVEMSNVAEGGRGAAGDRAAVAEAILSLDALLDELKVRGGGGGGGEGRGPSGRQAREARRKV